MSITHSLAGSLPNSPTGHASQQSHEVVCVSQSMLSHWNDLALLASPETSLMSAEQHLRLLCLPTLFTLHCWRALVFLLQFSLQNINSSIFSLSMMKCTATNAAEPLNLTSGALRRASLLFMCCVLVGGALDAAASGVQTGGVLRLVGPWVQCREGTACAFCAARLHHALPVQN
jgi:hypothetical protein